MHIEEIVESLCSKYHTRNPFEIASCENILVLKEPIGNVRGYYNKAFKQRMIHLNRNLILEEQRKTCAHELGHAIMHSESNTPFLQANTLFPIGKYEKEANYFAVNLLYSDEDMEEYLQFSIPEIAACLNLSNPLVEYRLSVMKKKPQFVDC